MKSSDEHEVQKAIKHYIDSIDEDKIKKYHIEGVELEYKKFSDNFFKEVRGLYKGNEELKNEVSILKKEKKKKEQDKLEFVSSKAKKIIEIINDTSSLVGFLSSVGLLAIEVKELKKRDKYEVWLDWALKHSRRIQLATHIAKLTHSSSQSSSIDLRFYKDEFEDREGYLSTDVSEDLTLDLAYTDNALSSIAKFYNIFVCNFFIGDLLRDDGLPYLRCFSSSDKKVSGWVIGFREGIRDKEKSSSFLSKQVYFPLDNENYHLLLPMVSSSMAHKLFTTFKFSEEKKLIFKQKEKNKYHEKPAVSYPNRATLNVTGSNHSNASSLNGKRGGKLALLPSLPPKWKSKQQLALTEIDLFNRQLSYRLREEIKDLQKILLIIKSKEISINKPAMHKAVVLAVNEIADGLFDEAIRINSSSDEKGWTQKSCLPLPQQLLLEPYRDDKIAIEAKSQWQAELADDFSYWLNKQLKHKKLGLTPIQQALWRDLFKLQLREYIAIQEVE